MTLTDEEHRTYIGKTRGRAEHYARLRRTRHQEWAARLEELSLPDLLATAPWGPFIKVPQLRKVEASRAFTLSAAERYGRNGSSIRPSVRTMATDHGISKDSVTDYLAIAIDLEWLDQCQESRISELPSERRTTLYEIRHWWADKPRTVMQAGFIPTTEDLLTQIEDRAIWFELDRLFNKDIEWIDGGPAHIPF